MSVRQRRYGYPAEQQLSKPYQAFIRTWNYPLARPIYVLLNDPRNALPWGFRFSLR